jgi:transposase-like protein
LRDDATELVDFWPVSSQRAVDAAAGFVEWVSRYNKADFLIVIDDQDTELKWIVFLSRCHR